MTDGQDEAGALFHAGRLQEAVEAANRAVRAAPADLGARVLLAELLLFTGNLERADVILDAAGGVEPEAAVVVAEFRQLLRAEVARRQLHRDGRVPEFLGEPTPALAAQLAMRVALRAGDAAGAAARAAEAEALRPRVPGATASAAFDDFRDADDGCAGFLEVLTTTGKYFWIPTERIETAEFHPPRRPRDLFWRRVSMSVRHGPDGDVYLPVLYVTSEPPAEDALRLGRGTEWQDGEGGLARGVGQRLFLAGEEALPIMECDALRFDGPPGGSPADGVA